MLLNLKGMFFNHCEQKNYKFFFYKDAPEDYFVFDDSLLDMFIEFNEEHELREKFNKDHFSFSFYKIFEPFLSNDIDAFETKSISILSNEEINAPNDKKELQQPRIHNNTV